MIKRKDGRIDYCFNEAKKLGVTPDYCLGKNCPNYPCQATKEFDEQEKYPACKDEPWCNPIRCRNWKNCIWNREQ